MDKNETKLNHMMYCYSEKLFPNEKNDIIKVDDPNFIRHKTFEVSKTSEVYFLMIAM